MELKWYKDLMLGITVCIKMVQTSYRFESCPDYKKIKILERKLPQNLEIDLEYRNFEA
jgi:hypothetical protein